ncbi:MAG TPA: AraC family transcriptional regulator [Capsulimonadaceae bacterium]|jgi:AraC family L-rhamnose operon transcriptional activator RhaR
MPTIEHRAVRDGRNVLTSPNELMAFSTTVDGDMDPHEHDFLEIAVIAAGSGTHVTQSAAEPLSVGDVIVLRPGAWHEFRNCDRLVVYNCCIAMRLIGGEVAFVERDPAVNDLLVAGPLAGGKNGVAKSSLRGEALVGALRELDALCAATVESDGSRPTVATLGRLIVAIAAIAHAVVRPSVRQASPHPPHPAALACRRLLEELYDHEWTLTELAATVHVAPEHLVRVFKHSVGIPPMAFLNRCRAERAASLLIRTSLPVSEIGARTGWPDASYFARSFRKAFGVSPTDYRRRFPR